MDQDWQGQGALRQGEGGPPMDGEPPQYDVGRQRDEYNRDGYRDDRDRYRDRNTDRDYGRDRSYDRDRDRDRRRSSKRSRSRSRSRSRRSGSPSRSRSRRSRSRSPSRERERPKKKKSNWDVVPTGMESAVKAVANPDGTVVHKMIMPTQPAPLVNPQLTRQARRLYVGGVAPNINENMLGAFFNEIMRKTNPARMDEPVVTVNANHEKMFAFVEFRTPEDATQALMYDGTLLEGTTLRVRRPKDYQGDPSMPAIPGQISDQVPDTPNKIFIGGLPNYLTAEQITELLKTFGEVKAFHLVTDQSTGQSKGFAFCEYIDPQVTDLACKGLNGMQLGDRALVVQRATSAQRQLNAGGPSADVATSTNMTPLGVPDAAAVLSSFAMPNADIVGVSAAVAAGNAQPSIVETTATRVLVLMNLATIEQLSDNNECEEIMDDVREEAVKTGKLLSIEMPRAVASMPFEEQAGVGKVYLEFESKEQAIATQAAMSGRIFNRRMVITTFYPEQKYQMRDLE